MYFKIRFTNDFLAQLFIIDNLFQLSIIQRNIQLLTTFILQSFPFQFPNLQIFEHFLAKFSDELLFLTKLPLSILFLKILDLSFLNCVLVIISMIEIINFFWGYGRSVSKVGIPFKEIIILFDYLLFWLLISLFLSCLDSRIYSW